MRIIRLLTVLIVCLIMPAAAGAATDIKVNFYNSIVTGPDGKTGTGTIRYMSLGAPSVSFGDNNELGTARIAGNEGVDVPVYPGSRIKIELPLGTCYMQAPDDQNFRNFVEWPEFVDGHKNQIRDVRFISGTPRSITVEVSSIDKGDISVLDFVFNKENLSKIRVSKLLESGQESLINPGWYVTRLEFFRMLGYVTEPFPASSLKNAGENHLFFNQYNDIHGLAGQDADRISPLADNGIILGYPGGWLMPFYLITRAEAVSATANFLPPLKEGNSFKDELPLWAKENIDSAKAYGVVAGYPDGTFRPEQFITKMEAVQLLQRMLESYNTGK
ncbi:MAG: S-layer homology domain-containing protein [Bacillota bacterium]